MRIHHNPPSHRWKSPSAPMFDATRAGKPRLMFRAENGKGDITTRTRTKWGGPDTAGDLDFSATLTDAETGEMLRPVRQSDPHERERKILDRHAHQREATRFTLARMVRPGRTPLVAVLEAVATTAGISIRKRLLGDSPVAATMDVIAQAIDPERATRRATNYKGVLSTNYTARPAQSGAFWAGGYGRK